jgi:hypothetical protein
LKRLLAHRRWWLAGLTVTLVVLRVTAAAVADATGTEAVGVAAALTLLNTACLVTAIAAIVGFVLYGRIYNARVPTE